MSDSLVRGMHRSCAASTNFIKVFIGQEDILAVSLL